MNEVEEARQLRQILGDLDATSEFPELNELPRAELLSMVLPVQTAQHTSCGLDPLLRATGGRSNY